MYDTPQTEITGVGCVLKCLIERWNTKENAHFIRGGKMAVVLLENKQSVIKTWVEQLGRLLKTRRSSGPSG